MIPNVMTFECACCGEPFTTCYYEDRGGGPPEPECDLCDECREQHEDRPDAKEAQETT